MDMEALREAIDIAGGQTALARKVCEYHGQHGRACKVKQAHVWNWLNRDHEVPAEHVLAVEAAVEHRVSRYRLRSDIYPLEEAAA